MCQYIKKRDWDPNNQSLSNLFQVIKCLLIIPFPQSALNEEAAKLYMEEYDEFVKITKMMTSVYTKLNKNKEDKKEEEM